MSSVTPRAARYGPKQSDRSSNIGHSFGAVGDAGDGEQLTMADLTDC